VVFTVSGKRLTRRSLLAVTATAAAGAILAACAPAPVASPAPAPAAKPTEAPKSAATSAPAANQAAAPTAVPAVKPAASTGQVTLFRYTVSTGVLFEPEKKWLQPFTDANPNIIVQSTERPAAGSSAYHDLLVTLFSGKDSSVDVGDVDTGANWPAELAPAGWLEPIDDILPKSVQDLLMPQMVYQSTSNGKIYSWPWMNDVGVFYVRKDLLDAAGKKAPETWQEVVDISKALMKPPELWGFIPCFQKSGQLSCNFQEYFWSNNGDMTDKDGKITINSPQVVEALQFAVDLVQTHKVTPDAVLNQTTDEGRQVFTEGKAVFHRNWNSPWFLSQAEGSKVKGNVQMTQVPKFGDNGTHVSNLGGWSYVVSAFSKHKDEAKTLIKWMGDAAQQRDKFLATGRPPAHQEAYKGEHFAKLTPALKEFAEPYLKISLTSKSRPRHPQYREIYEIIEIEAQAAIMKKKTAKEATDAMAKSLAPLLQGWKP
jgi:multiple sugar transport system substrate-binding protein